jgi:hypothetical protein
MGMVQRVVLQPLISISAPAVQEIRFAASTTGFKSALAWINCPKMNYSFSGVNIDILTGTSPSLLDPSSGGGSFWKVANTITITASTAGAYVSSSVFNVIGDLARWRTTTSINQEVQLEIILFLYDT